MIILSLKLNLLRLLKLNNTSFIESEEIQKKYWDETKNKLPILSRTQTEKYFKSIREDDKIISLNNFYHRIGSLISNSNNNYIASVA